MSTLVTALGLMVPMVTGPGESRPVRPTGTAIAAIPTAAPRVVAGVGPALQDISQLAFGPPGVLYLFDPTAGVVYGVEVGAAATPGTRDVANLPTKLAALVGTDTSHLLITDLAVEPASRNTYIAAVRTADQGAPAPALFRVDGAGTLALVPLDQLKFTSLALPAPSPPGGEGATDLMVNDMKFYDGHLYIAAKSKEAFWGKLLRVAYPFRATPGGVAGVELHYDGVIHSRAPLAAFTIVEADGQSYVFGGYLCSPLVKIPLAMVVDSAAAGSAAAPGAAVSGTEISGLGAANWPLDVVVYTKGAKTYVLISSVLLPGATRFTAAEIPAADTGRQLSQEQVLGEVGAPARIRGLCCLDKVEAEGAASIAQMAKLDEGHAVALALAAGGGYDLRVVDLP